MVIDVNLIGVFLCVREVVVKMIELGVDEGVIVNIFSLVCYGSFGQINYFVVKVGVVVMIEVWVKELFCYNICIGVIVFGIINIDMIVFMKLEVCDCLIGVVLLKCLGEVENIVKVVIFIFENDYFIGWVVEVDGGF